ncbi:MAG: UbiD family decarboxylase [Deltaproteobacteria bacterium]|nr:MAG: UbiD family decarboxylase [Deltaproteobacteria bacterium]
MSERRKESMQDITDMRGFIRCLEEMEELKTLKGADLNLEVGALTERAAEKEGPALLFSHFKGYPENFRVISNVFRTCKRTAPATGLPTDLKGVDFLYAWRRKLAAFKPVPVEQMEGGPIFENQMAENEVDLYKFPTPTWHELDGGPYLGTGCGVVTKDPETGKINIGTYRVMIQSKDKVSVKMNMGKHGRLAFERSRAAGKPLPVAITLGQGPSVFLAAQMPLPPDVNEYEFAGFLQGSPVPVVRGAVTGLPIPANAEVVLEGELPPMKDEEMPREGPFGEWPGYFTDANVGETPVMVVKRVYYRNDPIILGAPPLKPPASYLPIPLGAATLWEQLEKAGVPDVKGVWGFVYGGQPGPFTVISIKQRYAGHSKQALLVAAGARAGAYGGKFVVVVDDDIDITNPNDVIWAIATRCYVREGIDLVKSVWASVCEPAMPPEERSPKGYLSDRVLIDACRPYRWMDDFPKVNAFDKEFKDEIERKWKI